MKNVVLAVLFLCLIPMSARAETYVIDPAHSTFQFSVSHLLISRTYGDFRDFSGRITVDGADFTTARMQATIQAASIDTRLEARDKHLRAADYFDTEKYPLITFQSREVIRSGDGYLIQGDLTIRGVTKPVSISATIQGPIKSPYGDTLIGINGETTINRLDFGVSGNPDAVGSEVKISISLEAKQEPSSP